MIALVIPERVPWEGAIRSQLGAHRVIRPPSVDRITNRLSAARRIAARLAQRRFADRLAATLLTRGTTAVVAPSLACRRTFEAARARGARCVLLEDLPDLEGLHADLDAAARAHPAEGFLKNTRARPSRIACQQAERALADEIRVQSRYAADRFGGSPLFPPAQPAPVHQAPLRHIQLAGPAMARTGALEAMAMLDRLPGVHLRIRAIDATPEVLLAHPRVTTKKGMFQCVVAPSWVESWPAEVRRAHAAGIPIVGTARALGWSHGTIVEPGDPAALAAAVSRSCALPGPAARPPAPGSPIPV